MGGIRWFRVLTINLMGVGHLWWGSAPTRVPTIKLTEVNSYQDAPN